MADVTEVEYCLERTFGNQIHITNRRHDSIVLEYGRIGA